MRWRRWSQEEVCRWLGRDLNVVLFAREEVWEAKVGDQVITIRPMLPSGYGLFLDGEQFQIRGRPWCYATTLGAKRAVSKAARDKTPISFG
jgi:hypothetical protein